MATYKYGIKLGPGQLQIESESMPDFLMACGVLSHATECGNCKGKDIIPNGESNSQGHQFFSFKCLDCKHELKFGQRQDADKTLFLKHWEGWHPPFEGKRGNGGAQPSQKSYAPPGGGSQAGPPSRDA